MAKGTRVEVSKTKFDEVTMANQFSNVNQMGGLRGQTGQPTPSPDYPTWDQLFYFQQHIMDLQQEVIRLQKELDKIKNTKEWLVGPESAGADVAK